MRAFFFLALFVLSVISAISQTVLISPTGAGGFENGPSFTDNGWIVVNGTQANKWFLGTTGTYNVYQGVRGAYISSDASGANNNYSTTSSTTHFYRDISFPAGENDINLSFRYNCRGENNTNDELRVYLCPTTITPVAGTIISSAYQIGAYHNYLGYTTPKNTLIEIDPVFAGQTMRLVFSWKNNSTTSYSPAASVDSISLVSQTSIMTYIFSTSNQASTDTICSCHLNQKILQILIVTGAVSSPAIDATSFTFSTAGSNDAANDLKNARLFFTGNSNLFATTTQLGSTTSNPNGSFVVDGFTQSLDYGNNYFWLSYDLTSSATAGNVVDAECHTVTVGGSSYTPTITSPAGSRTISPFCPPYNDHCFNAISLSPGVPVTASNEYADVSTGLGPFPGDPNNIGEFLCNSSVDNYVYFSFTTVADGDYSITISQPTSCNIGEGLQAAVFAPVTECPATGSWGSPLACTGRIFSTDYTLNLPALSSSTTYYLVVDGWAGDECNFSVTLNNSLLPVELTSYTAHCIDDGVVIQWQTVTEINNDFFTIEKSNDLSQWVTLAVISGAGNSSTPATYGYVDDLHSGNSYYRLSQTDFDGNSELFSTVSVQCVSEYFLATIVLYNVTKDEIQIRLTVAENENALLQITGCSGQVVYSQDKQLSAGENDFTIGANNLNQGCYVVCIATSTKISKPQKLIIAR